MKTLVGIMLIISASFAMAQDSTDAKWGRARFISNVYDVAMKTDKAKIAEIEADTSKVFVIEKIKFDVFDSAAKPKYGTKKQLLKKLYKELDDLKKARDKEVAELLGIAN